MSGEDLSGLLAAMIGKKPEELCPDKTYSYIGPMTQTPWPVVPGLELSTITLGDDGYWWFHYVPKREQS